MRKKPNVSNVNVLREQLLERFGLECGGELEYLLNMDPAASFLDYLESREEVVNPQFDGRRFAWSV